MITPEQLISNLQKQNAVLEEELAQAQKDIRDFEVLAIEWKKGHRDLESKHRIKIKECEQVIGELEDENEELRSEIILIRGQQSE